MSRLQRLVLRLVLYSPARVAKNLAKVADYRGPEGLPNLWQLGLGVMRMHHRVLFRFDSVGTSGDHPVRKTWRARALHNRLLRFPFLLFEGAVAPWDYTGLMSSQERLTRHLLGAHHDGNQFVYDLQLAGCYAGCLESIRDACRDVVDGSDPRAEWLRDLTVYEGYHEALLGAVERALAQTESLKQEEINDPDVSFWAYLKWCARQPPSAASTWRAWRAGRFSVADGLQEASC